MKTTEEKFGELIYKLRGFALNAKSAASLVYVLKTWKDLKCSEDLSFNKFYQGELKGDKLAKVFECLTKKNNLFGAYLKQDYNLTQYAQKELAPMFNFVRSVDELPKVGYAFWNVFAKYERLSEAATVPNEISELAAKLVAKEAKTIYVPFTQALSLVYSYPDKEYFYEDRYDNSFLLELLKQNDHINVKFEKSDPLLAPAFTQPNAPHLLKTFDAGICFPPFSMRPDKPDIHKEDKFQRFHIFEGKGSSEIPVIEHLLAQVSHQAVVLLPLGITFRSGVAQTFRKYLTENNLVDAVIRLPPGILNNTGIETVLLVLNKAKVHKEVFFFNAKHEQFTITKNRKNCLNNIDQIVEIVEKKQGPEDISKSVTIEELHENDFSFAIDRYILNKEVMELSNSLSNFKRVKLEEKAVLIRSQLMQETDDGEEIYEITPADLPEAGFIKPAGRIRKIDTHSKSFSTYQLNTADVLLTSRGTIGKVGIVGEETNFIASQSFHIIRLRKRDLEDAKYLYLFFKSKIGQAMLNQNSSGESMQQIPPSVLANLEIPWPDKEVRKRLIANFESESQLCEKIAKLKTEISNLHESFLCDKDA